MSANLQKKLQQMLWAALLYAGLTIPLRYICALIPGTEVRVSAFLPPLLGFIWGLPGAIGIALGNIICDTTSGMGLHIIIFGGMGNFLCAYLPYKMWYTIGTGKAWAHFGLSARKIMKFLLILLSSAFISSLFLSLTIAYNHVSPPREFFFLVFVNNFDFSLLLTTPLLILLAGLGFKFHPPVIDKKLHFLPNCWPFNIILLLCIIASCIFIFVPFTDLPQAQSICLFLQVGIFIYCLKPFSAIAQAESDPCPVKYPLYFKITLASCLFAICFVLLLAFSTFIASPPKDNLSYLEIWERFYHNIFYSTHFIFTAFIIFLFLTEAHLVDPLLKLTKSANSFSLSTKGESLNEALLPKINTNDELEILAKAQAKMIHDLNLYITEIKDNTAERERAAAELNIAAHIQKAMLPNVSSLNDISSRISLSAMMIPAKAVGGDFYDCFFIDKNHIALVIADVSGKGIPAALFMVITKTILHTKLSSGMQPADILYHANNELCEQNPESMFSTTFIGIYETHTHKLTYANAGHCKPILLRGIQTHLLKERSGPMLASMENISYHDYQLFLQPGDLLFLYTDGITEAQNTHKEFFQEKRLLEILASLNTSKEKENAAATTYRTLTDFTKGTEQYDDLTILTLLIH